MEHMPDQCPANWHLDIIMPTLDTDVTSLKAKIASLEASLRSLRFPYSVMVVIQSKDGFHIDFGKTSIRPLITTYISVSNARNMGLERARGDYILFLDDDVTLDQSFVEFMNECLGRQEVFAGRLSWNRWLRRGGYRHYTSVVCMNIFAVVISRPLIERIGLRFDTSLGLGEDVQYRSGEDVLFLYSLFARSGNRRLLFNPRAIVFHKERDLIREKQKIIEYALGQGRTWRRMLAVEPRFMNRTFLFLLFLMTLLMNAVRVVREPDVRLPVVINRIKGFVNG